MPGAAGTWDAVFPWQAAHPERWMGPHALRGGPAGRGDGPTAAPSPAAPLVTPPFIGPDRCPQIKAAVIDTQRQCGGRGQRGSA